MKFTNVLVIAALMSATNAVEVSSSAVSGDWFTDKTPPPTASGTPSSGYFGADEDDVMNNIFNHYAVEVANAAGQKTGKKRCSSRRFSSITRASSSTAYGFPP